MDITPLVDEKKKIIQSYGTGRFKINGELFEQAVIVMPDNVITWHVEPPLAECSVTDFQPILAQADEIDVVFVGCGKSMEMIPAEIKTAFQDKNIVIEAMDTGAACRTYNVLLMEGRRVVAALMG